MTTARMLARATRQKLSQVVDVPPAAGEMVENILARHFEMHGAIEALRPILDHCNNIIVTKGHIPADPPLSEEELAQLVTLMSDGRLPVIRSFVGLTRALLERMKDKP
jgi:hypothetical protein